MKLLEFLKLCSPYTDCLIFNKSIKSYILDDVESVGYILDNYHLADFNVVGFSIDFHDVLDDGEYVRVSYLSIVVEEV